MIKAINKVQATGAQFNNLALAEKYTVCVATNNDLHSSKFASKPIVVGALPGAPFGLHEVSGTASTSSLTVTWFKPLNTGDLDVAYEVSYFKDEDEDVQILDTESELLELTGLKEDTTYNFEVVAINEVGVSKASNLLVIKTSAKPKKPVPPPPVPCDGCEPPPDEDEADPKWVAIAIAAIVISVIVLLCVIGALIYCLFTLCCKNKKKD